MEGEEKISASLQAVKEFLAEEGFRPSVKAGDLRIEYRGWSIVVGSPEDDPEYFWLQLPFFYEFESEEEMRRGLEVASDVNRRFKVGKAYVTEDRGDVIAMVGVFVKSPEEFLAIYRRYLSILVSVAVEFRADMAARTEQEKGEEPGPPPA